MTFVSSMERVTPPYVAAERDALEAMLDYYRATTLTKLEGLDDEQMRRVMVPSGLCLLGVVKHLIGVEHGWFVKGVGKIDEPWLFSTPEDPDADFRIEPEDTTDSIVQGYVQACERSRQIVGDVESLDYTIERPRRGEIDLRWILVHMIEETARHAGHMDIMRELIDGATGD